ncbi:hypothetical protein [Leadbetterella sp. DM7]|uniref:hypothetical protein n=1 Tax=Leadbetterella sp. DM7 TaxID=3235085 RepID=UPI00349EE907
MKKLVALTGFLILSFALKAQQPNPNDYTGVYKFQGTPFAQIVISYENGAFMADAEGVGKGQIVPSGTADEFTEDNYEALLKFVRETSGKVIRLVVSFNGSSFEGAKEGISFDEYAGKYSLEGSSEVSEVNITVQNGTLGIEASIGGSQLMATDVKDSFQMTAASGGVVFKRDATGRITGIEVEYAGNTFKGKKK